MKLKLSELRSLIKEAFKKSDAEAMALSFENAAGRIGSKVSVLIDTSGKMMNIFIKFISGDVEKTEDALVACAIKSGWSLLTRSEKRGLTWWFEPNPEVKGPVSKKLIPAELWHVTPSINVADILAQGLSLRQRTAPGTTRKYSPRIYLATDPKVAKATINQKGDWALLRIDASKLPKGFKFYVDQEFGHRADGQPLAVYSLDPIPSVAISSVD